MVLRVRIVVGAGVADRVPRYSEKAAHESFADDCFRGCCAVGVQRAAGGELLSSFRISRDRKQRAVFDESAVPTRTTRRHHQRALKPRSGNAGTRGWISVQGTLRNLGPAKIESLRAEWILTSRSRLSFARPGSPCRMLPLLSARRTTGLMGAMYRTAQLVWPASV